MKTPLTLLTFAICAAAFLIVAPTAPAQSPETEEKIIELAHKLKLTPKQEVEILPILRAEGPKFDAIKNDPALTGIQRVQGLRALHAENAPQLEKILTPHQYHELQEIREAAIKKAIEAKLNGN